jgi:hypothetical protein
MNLITLIRLFIKANGRRPTPNELSELQKKAMAPKSADVIPFPSGGKDRVPVNEQFKNVGVKDMVESMFGPLGKKSEGGIESLDEFKKAEDVYEGTISRIKGGISTKIKLNGPASNRDYAKELIGGKSEEFNSLKSEDKKELLDLLEAEIKKDMEEIPFAKGGLANVLGV